tara:strand:- start:205 stop:507 length:303 start_codon:yes stop_codon:yes gene_type:complete
MNLKKELEYITPHIQLAKRRGVKLNHHNLKKLHSVWLDYCYKEKGFNGLFWAAYSDHIEILIQQPSRLLDLVKKNDWIGGTLPVPQPIVRYNRYISIDKK